MIVKRKDGYYVLSEKTQRNLGGPYKTEEEAKKHPSASRILQALKRQKVTNSSRHPERSEG